MSTTSADEYECYSCQYENYYTNPTPGMSTTHFYPTMAEPFIYYAHIPPGQSPHKKGRKSPNCFVKAFRWYTQEHFPQSSYQPVSPGFATWLDGKYEEYLRETGNCTSSYCRQYTVLPTQTPVVENTNVEQCQPCTGPKFKLKSPWRKRRYCNNTNTKDTECRVDGGCGTNRSLVYILEPKELTRPASDCCHPVQTPCCSQFDVCKSKKSLVKSQSATNCCQTMALNIPPVDQVRVMEGEKTENKPVKREKEKITATKKEKVKDLAICECGNTPTPPAPPRPKTKSEECQCILVECPPVVVKTENIDTECQYKNSKIFKGGDQPVLTLNEQSTKTTNTVEIQSNECYGGPNRPNICPGCGVKVTEVCRRPSVLSIQTATKSTNRKLSINEDGESIAATVVNKTVDSSIKVIQHNNEMCHYNRVCCNCSEPPTYYCNGLLYVDPNRKIPMTTDCREVCCSKSGMTSPSMIPRTSITTSTCTKPLVSDTVQTSDHSICLENTIRGYPLFMRIVCADKLNDECACKRKSCI